MSNVIKLKTVPKFPGRVLAGPAIDVGQADGTWAVELDYSKLTRVSPYTPQDSHYALIYDANNDKYFLVPTTSFS